MFRNFKIHVDKTSVVYGKMVCQVALMIARVDDGRGHLTYENRLREMELFSL